MQVIEEQKSRPRPLLQAPLPAVDQNETSASISGKLEKIVGQLSIITKTLQVLEQRMATTEQQVAGLMEASAAPPAPEPVPAMYCPQGPTPMTINPKSGIESASGYFKGFSHTQPTFP
eukprot:TRINITY_DN18208_c0_g1_i2.p2 TRINITY_DN18208_c0_g1~~TRINITY_DN18208_c0_g1_i2.p2  ORF type:complete len:118 (-),score=17.30 TRINITY_DN18208_c0_g1_i2:51-404(-)